MLLAGLYGAVVVCYGILVGYAGWPGISRLLLIFLSAMYVVVAALPVFVPKSEIGTIKGYVSVLVRLANLAEWRCGSLRDSVPYKSEGKFAVFLRSWRIVRAFCSDDLECKWCRLIRFGGLTGSAITFVALACIIFGKFGLTGERRPLVMVAYILLGCLMPEIMLAWIVRLKCQVGSAVKTKFDATYEAICIFVVSVSAWLAQFHIASGLILKLLIFILLLWWLVRAFLAVTLNPEGRRSWLAGFRRHMEVGVGVRCIVGVWIDEELPDNIKLAVSYFDDNLQVVDELSVAAALIVPENYVVNRVRDNGVNESRNLKEYMSKVVKVTLPPVPKTGSGAGK